MTDHTPDQLHTGEALEHRQVFGIDVRDCGAMGDGITDDSAAIQRALDRGCPRVVIPVGTYRIGSTLRLPAGAHLIVHPQATLRLADGAGVDDRSFLVTNATGARDIQIEGGIWDGNNQANPRGPDAPGSYTGVVLGFEKMVGLSLRHMRIREPESFYIRLGEVRRFCVEHIQFEARTLRPNQDGVHVGGGCEDGVIRHLRAWGSHATSDDMVAINADDALERGPLLNLVNAPIRRVRIEHLRADDCHSFVRLLSCWSPIEDVTVEHVRGGCRVSAFNMDAARDAMVPLFDPRSAEVAAGVGMLRRVQIRDISVHKAATGDAHPLIDLRTRCENVSIHAFERMEHCDSRLDVPTLRIEQVGSVGFVLEGIDEAQVASLPTDHAGAAARLTMPSMSGSPRYRVAGNLQQDETLDLARGSFDHLSLTGSSHG